MQIHVYVSYAWEPESKDILQKLEKEFNVTDLNLIYDQKSTKYKSRIQAFMDDIGKAQHVVIILSEKYLHSENCMYELLKIYENGDFERRIHPIVLPSAKIYSSIDRMKHTEFWNNKIKEFHELFSKLPADNKHSLVDDITLYAKIESKVSALLAILKDINSLSHETHENSNFRYIIEAIISGSSKNNSITEEENLYNDNPSNYIQTLIETTHTLKSLSAWIKNNRTNLIENALTKLLISTDDYSRSALSSKKTLNQFKKSIADHFVWITTCLDKKTSRISLDEYIGERLIIELPSAYKDFFKLMYEAIKNPEEEIGLATNELLFLFNLLEHLIKKYES